MSCNNISVTHSNGLGYKGGEKYVKFLPYLFSLL